jgi:hypothetical protein
MGVGGGRRHQRIMKYIMLHEAIFVSLDWLTVFIWIGFDVSTLITR